MDPRHRRRPSSDRFLSTFSPPSAPTPLTFTTTSSTADDFSEDDVFFTSPTLSTTIPKKTNNHLPSTATSPRPPSLRSQRSFKLESPGILAALPEPPSSPALSVFNHKSPSRTISIIPQNSPSMTSDHRANHLGFSLPAKYHQSAPMHVPVMPTLKGGRKQRRRQGSAFGFEDIEDALEGVEDDDDGEMLPPHEMVARRLEETPVLSCSVLEGAGRTLKGRDLRQVRNAVFRQTGSIMPVPTSRWLAGIAG